MLILQRRVGESIRIGDDIEITVVSTEGGRVRLSISAPKEITILRSELIGAQQTNRESAMDQVASADLFGLIDQILPAAPKTDAPVVSSVKLATKNEKDHPAQ